MSTTGLIDALRRYDSKLAAQIEKRYLQQRVNATARASIEPAGAKLAALKQTKR